MPLWPAVNKMIKRGKVKGLKSNAFSDSQLLCATRQSNLLI
jgi:hypothetical protein